MANSLELSAEPVNDIERSQSIMIFVRVMMDLSIAISIEPIGKFNYVLSIITNFKLIRYCPSFKLGLSEIVTLVVSDSNLPEH